MSEIVFYTSPENLTQIEVTFENETVWLSLNQISELFGRDKSVISRHLKNIFKSEELNKASVVAKNATTATDGKTYEVDYFNLDVIISVGYRVKSKQGTQFRQWVTQRLKEYLVQGYAINERRLLESETKFQDLKKAVQLAANTGNIDKLSAAEATGILGVIAQYAYALETLDKYDHQNLTIDSVLKTTAIVKLSYKTAVEQINIWRAYQKAGHLFGNEKDQSFQSSLETIYSMPGATNALAITPW